jgi:hypothetical protein
VQPLSDHASCLGKKITTRAAVISVHETDPTHATGASGEALTALARFRQGFHDCLTRRADTLFELTDALLCAPGPVTSLVELSMASEHRRGHGSLYDGLNAGRIDLDRLHNLVACQQVPRDGDGRIVLAVDVSAWLRPGADTSPDRAFCHTYTRGGGKQMVPGWPYSFIAALEPGRSSWTALLHAQRLAPDDDDTAVSAAQLRTVVTGQVSQQHGQAGAGAAACQPGVAVPGPCPHTGTGGLPAPARRGVPVRRRDDLARPGAQDQQRDPPLWPGAGAVLARVARHPDPP